MAEAEGKPAALPPDALPLLFSQSTMDEVEGEPCVALPPDALQRVFGHLVGPDGSVGRDLARVVGTCRSWRDAGYRQELWQKLCQLRWRRGWPAVLQAHTGGGGGAGAAPPDWRRLFLHRLALNREAERLLLHELPRPQAQYGTVTKLKALGAGAAWDALARRKADAAQGFGGQFWARYALEHLAGLQAAEEAAELAAREAGGGEAGAAPSYEDAALILVGALPQKLPSPCRKGG